MTDNFYITRHRRHNRTDAGRVRKSSGVRFRKELAPLRRGWPFPSSESLTHAAIYESDPTISAVIHCHDSVLWATLLDRAPTTSKSVAYGTPEMAYEIMRLFKVSDVRSREIFVMAGHEAGIVTFGKNLEDAFDVVMRERELPQPCDAGRQYASHSSRMPALPDNTRSEYPSQLRNRFARGEREHVARSSRHVVGLNHRLALTAVFVNVRCARKCMTALRIGTKRRRYAPQVSWN